MNITREMLEVLIGKYIDGEITPSEQQMLEEAMESNPDTRELLEQLQDLHQRSCEVISSEVLEQGRAADEIFEQAWLHRKKNSLHRLTKVGGRLRFVAGLAAGLVIGLTIHFTLPARPIPRNELVSEQPIAKSDVDEPVMEDESLRLLPSNHSPEVFRNVDLYSFTDKDGDHWIVEGLRENIVTPAAYNGDL